MMGYEAVTRTEPSASAAMREDDDTDRPRWNTEKAVERDILTRHRDRLLDYVMNLWRRHDDLSVNLSLCHAPPIPTPKATAKKEIAVRKEPVAWGILRQSVACLLWSFSPAFRHPRSPPLWISWEIVLCFIYRERHVLCHYDSR